MKLGFAHYETADYAEGLHVFEKMHVLATEKKDQGMEAVALIWQGHMLDLLGRRDEAVARYSQVAKMNIHDTYQHSQYGLTYEIAAYAKERMDKPFVRVENREK